MRLGGKTITSNDSTSFLLWRCSSWRAFRDAQLNSSDPQKRMRNGSDEFRGTLCEKSLRHGGICTSSNDLDLAMLNRIMLSVQYWTTLNFFVTCRRINTGWQPEVTIKQSRLLHLRLFALNFWHEGRPISLAWTEQSLRTVQRELYAIHQPLS